MAERGVSIGRDAYGNAIVTGDNNLTFVFLGVDAVPAEVLEALRAGRRLADLPGAVPLPALVLAIALADDGLSWRVSARRATGDPVERHGASPWLEPGFAPLSVFAELGRVPAETAVDAGRLQVAAQRLGEVLAGALSGDEVAFLVAAGHGDPPPPLLLIESADERVLALPWELLRLEGQFVVHDGRLDVARSLPVAAAPVLSPPEVPFSLLVNVSAPAGSGLDYERESYAIVRALHEHVGVVINEMGEVEDLVSGLRRDPPPVGVHFSGHGGRGTLLFEDEYGEARVVAVPELLTEIRQHGPERLPRFFFLACCHGGDAPDGEDGLAATATALHADGVAQVVAYFGPVLDEASTRAERAFYAELARGRLTRDAVRAARLELGKVQAVAGRQGLRDAGAAGHGGELAYGWAQMVLYQRGPDYPLGTPIAPRASVAVETTERRKLTAYPGSRSQVLQAGFVGRRKEMHDLRRDLRASRYLHVVQGIGGLGKSAFCNEALKLYARLGWKPVALWCGDVEGAAEPVAGLLRQFEAAGRQLVKADDVWDRLLAQLEQWAAGDVALQSPSARLLALLRVLLDGDGPPLVVYLDNLESLQRGPERGAADEYATWREPGAAALWQGLRDLVTGAGGRLAVLASGRYRHPDYVGRVVPFRGLPRDALWRLLRWFPSLRLLSEAARKGLVDRLAGHPRAVEFLEALIAEAIARWEDEHGPFEPGRLSVEDEQAQIIVPALPQLTAKLSEDLLFAALWERVLNVGARELLVRASVLRRPGNRALLLVLADAAGEAAFNRLRASGLLTELREPKPQGGWTLEYEVHPLVAELALGRSPRSAELRAEAHRLAGTQLEQVAQTSPSWQDNIEAAHHLRQVGEVDRSYDLLAPLVQVLLDRGRLLEARGVLAEIGEPNRLQPARAAVVRIFAGDVAVATGELAAARDAYRASLAIAERLAAADPSNASWQRDLSVSHNKLGDVLVAQGQLEDALAAYRASLALRERLAAADPSNATWQRDLFVSFAKLGLVLEAAGDLVAAAEHYERAHKISVRLSEHDPSNATWRNDRAWTQARLTASSGGHSQSE